MIHDNVVKIWAKDTGSPAKTGFQSSETCKFKKKSYVSSEYLAEKVTNFELVQKFPRLVCWVNAIVNTAYQIIDTVTRFAVGDSHFNYLKKDASIGLGTQPPTHTTYGPGRARQQETHVPVRRARHNNLYTEPVPARGSVTK